MKKLFFGLSGFFLLFAVMFYFRDARPRPVTQTGPVSPASLPSSASAVANLEEFRVLTSNAAAGNYEFQLDAREPWQKVPVTVSDGDTVDFSAEGRVCGPAVGCVGPNGQDGPASNSLTRPEEFPVGGAYCQALVARIGPQKFQVGDHKTYTVPTGTGSETQIELMDNYRLPELARAAGGFKVRITVRPRQ